MHRIVKKTKDIKLKQNKFLQRKDHLDRSNNQIQLYLFSNKFHQF